MYGGDPAQRGKVSQRRHLLAVFFFPLLFVLFGMSSWMSVNTIWVEMPLLASSLPEAWSLPAYVSVIIQLGNVGPLAMIAVRNKNRYATFIYMIIALLVVANLTLAFVFKITVPVLGQDHSVALFVLVFFLALCDCTSSVTFLPYLANFNPRYLVYFFIGQGMGGLVPSALGLIQGSGTYTCVVPNSTNSTTTWSTKNQTNAFPVYSPARFDFPVFMFAAVGILMVSLGSFILIETILRRLKVQAVKESKMPTSMPSINERATAISDMISLPQLDPFSTNRLVDSTNQSNVASEPGPSGQDRVRTSQESGDELLTDTVPAVAGSSTTSPTVYDAVDSGPPGSVFQDGERAISNKLNHLPFKRKVYSAGDFIPHYFLNAFLCFMINGLLPSVQSYSALPYGQLVYSLVACFWVAAVPLASWLTMCAKVENIRWLGGIGAIGVIPTSYVLALAFLCPTVPLQQHAGGYFLAVFSWFLASAIFFYTRVCIAQRVQLGGHKALFWFGLSTQGASLVGAIVAFVLIPVLRVFRDPKLC